MTRDEGVPRGPHGATPDTEVTIMATRRNSTGPTQTDMARALKGLTDGTLTIDTLPESVRAGLLGIAQNAEDAQKAARAAMRDRLADRLGSALGTLITDGTLGERQTFKSGAEGYSHSSVKFAVDGTEYVANVLIRDASTIPAK